MAVQTGLDYMRSRTLVDCDTMDEEGTNLGPTGFASFKNS
jgi:hypothetical protein